MKWALGAVPAIAWSSVLVVILSNCASPGPTGIRWERTDYNVAIQETQNEQLLLNLVRLRYSDTPIFLELSGIASQLATAVGASAGAGQSFSGSGGGGPSTSSIRRRRRRARLPGSCCS